MKGSVSFNSAVYFTKLSVHMACTWPPSKTASKWQLAKYDVIWVLAMFNVSCFALPHIASLYANSSNSIAVTQSTCFVFGGCNYFVKTILYRVRRRRMKFMMDDMKDFNKNAQSHEKIILQNYLDGYWFFHVIIIVMNYITAISLSFGPLILPEILQDYAYYPSSIASGYTKYLTYVNQITALLQYAAGISTDCHIAMIVWYAAARIEILAAELKNLSDASELHDFVRKHQRLISYAVNAADTICYGALVTAIVCGTATIMSCIQLVTNQPYAVKLQFIPLLVICTANLFISAWPAENLLTVCDLVATATYGTSWTDMSVKSRKDVLIILRRSQKPVTVSIGGFIPTLSLRYYASFLSAAFSYFTTLRIALMSDHEK